MWPAIDTLLIHTIVGLQALGLFLLLHILLALLVGPAWLLSYYGLRSLTARQRRPPIALQHLRGLLAWGILAVYLPVQRQRQMNDLRLLTAASTLAVAIIGGALRPDLQLALWTYAACIGFLASRPGFYVDAVTRLTGAR